MMSAFTKRVAHLREEWPLVLGFLDAVSNQPFHGLWAVLIELAEIWGQIASSHHEYNLTGREESECVEHQSPLTSAKSAVCFRDPL